MGRAAALLALLPQQQAHDFIIKSLFNEFPDRGAALAAMSLWAAVSCVLVVLTIRTRTWFMMVAGEQTGQQAVDNTAVKAEQCCAAVQYIAVRLRQCQASCCCRVLAGLKQLLPYFLAQSLPPTCMQVSHQLLCDISSLHVAAAATAGFMQLAGYALRATLLDQSRPQLTYFTAMVALFLISPSLLADTNYLCLGKLLSTSRAALPTNYKLRRSDHNSSAGGSLEDAEPQGSGFASVLGSVLGVSRVGFSEWGWRFSAAVAVTAAFCVGELIALILQGIGAALIATSAASSKFKESSRITQQNGRWLLLAGVCMQLLVFTVFTGFVLAVKFGKKFGYAGTAKFRAVFGCLFATMVCQYVRQIFRAVVYVSGLTAFLATHERYGVYGFDFAPLIACGMLFCFLHYGFFFGRAAPAGLKLQQQSSSKSSSRAVLVPEGTDSADI
jgi:hypothetical protein